MPQIDVLVPSYQYGRFLPECINSIRSQDVDLRILILDNASTDDSVEIARQLASEDARIEVRTRETNLGLMASFNEGVDWASSPYFAIVCADDLVAPGALSRAVRLLDDHPSAAFLIGRELEYIQDEPFPHIDQSQPESWRMSRGVDFIDERCRNPASFVALWTLVTRTSVQKQAGHYKAHLSYTEDVEMMLRLASFGDVVETSAVQAIRRLHGKNMSNVYLKGRKSDLIYRKAAFDSFLDERGNALADPTCLRKTINRNIAIRAARWSARALLHGELGESWDLLRYAASVSSRLGARA